MRSVLTTRIGSLRALSYEMGCMGAWISGQKSGTEGLDVPKVIEFSMRAKPAESVTSGITAFLARSPPLTETAESEAEVAEGLSSDVRRVIDENCRTLRFGSHGFEKS